ncbi:MAG: 3-oxoacyl-[acyl-carrier protein] reductase [Bryobacterales bacterium]|nr:3-oxoacyl-[acyl-carrier protein] reductase [Bryobacterales bacterium]
MSELSGKTALVTGSNRGIGRAIAKRLSVEGANVVLCARDEALLNEAAAEIRASGGNAAVVPIDLRDTDAGQRVVDEAVKAFGFLDIVVNNAGATKRGDFVTLSEDDWMDGYALKMFGAVRVTRAAWPHLKARNGAVVNISGSGGRTPGAQFTIGGSVNAALLSLTKALADLGLQDGIQVNAINPGPVRTGRFEKRLAQTAADHGVDRETALGIFLREERITKVGEPEDIAGLVAYILSKNGRYLHGSLIDADGGSTKTI